MEEDAVVAAASILFLLLNVLASALLAGLIAVLMTKTTDTWGGAVGGFVCSTPGLVIPLSLGVALTSADSAAALHQAMWLAPVGIFLASTFLVMWRLLPVALPKTLGSHRLAITVVSSLASWLSGAIVCYFAIGALQRVAHLPIQSIGAAALVLNFALSAPTACMKPGPAMKGPQCVSTRAYALRAALAAGVVGAAVLVSNWDPTLGGIGAGFPALALACLVGVWVNQGERFTAGAVGPIMLSGLSASIYCIVFGTLYATLFGLDLGQPLSLLLALSASYLLAVVAVSTPMFAFYWWVAAITKKRRSRQREVEEEEGVMVEEEDEENGQRPHLNNRGAVVEQHGSSPTGDKRGDLENLAVPLLGSNSGPHPTYQACGSGDSSTALSRMAVRRHLSEETEQRTRMKGHDRLQDDHHHQRAVDDAHEESGAKKKEDGEARKWVDVVVDASAGDAIAMGDADVVMVSQGEVDMGGSGEVEGKLQPTPNERTLTPLR